MKLKYIVPYVNQNGGIQRYAKTAASFMQSQGIEVEMIDWAENTNIFVRLTLRYAPANITKYLYLRFQGARTFINSKHVEITHHWIYASALSGPRVAPYIVTCHGKEILQNNVHGARRQILVNILSEADTVVVPSNFTRGYIIKNYNISPEKINVIYPGIDTKKYKPMLNIKNSPDFKVGSLCRLVDRKNLINVIEALVVLKEKYKVSFTYYLAGDGPDRKKILQALRKSKINYEYLGAISEEFKVEKFYPGLDVFVLPPFETKSDVEGFGIVFIEANASGVPVVTSNTGGVADAVKPYVSGLFVDPLSPEDIADKVYKILFSKKDWRKSSRNWAENFDQRFIADKFNKLYERIGS